MTTASAPRGPQDVVPRQLLDRVSPAAGRAASAFHSAIVQEVEQALRNHPVVVVGMVGNPHVKRVRQALHKAAVPFHYLEYGSYFSRWQERLAIKMWSGWPTFPQVFVHGALLGGEDLTMQALDDGFLQRLLAAEGRGDGASDVAVGRARGQLAS